MIDPDGWLYTGDIGHVDDDGYFYIVDRVKELMKYKAFVVATAELSAQEIMEYVAERVAPHKRVRAVEFIDQIPKSPSGRILRRLLMEPRPAADRPPAGLTLPALRESRGNGVGAAYAAADSRPGGRMRQLTQLAGALRSTRWPSAEGGGGAVHG
jgi:acyl-CoA synthetase (AMP-forming)/AMP-acid ligase II